MSNSYNAPPAKELKATPRDIITAKNALAALLEEETNYMSSMQLSAVGQLQDRKLKLVGLLERYCSYVQKHPEIMENIAADEKGELLGSVETMQRVMKRNYDTLLVARAVNRTVVNCITDSLNKRDQNPVYNARGAVTAVKPTLRSFTLNQTV